MSTDQGHPHTKLHRLAEFDSDLALDGSTRGLRIQLEFAAAEQELRRWGIESTVVVFGSSRVRDTAESSPRAQRWYDEARRLARIVSERGGALTEGGMRRHVIATGGGPGIMEAANRGAHDAGAPSIGFNIELPVAQTPNPYSTPELTFRFHYFAMRKMHLAMRAAALVVFPGGFGTLDELFEMLTLAQTGKMQPLPILGFDRDFWRTVINIDALVDADLLPPIDRSLITWVDNADEAWTVLAKAGIGR